MGFIIMVLSAIIGIFLIALGISGIKNKKNKLWNIIAVFCNLVRISKVKNGFRIAYLG